MPEPRDPPRSDACDGDGDAAAATDLDAVRIERMLAREATSLGRPLVVLPITASTNDDAKRAARAGAPEGTLFVADAQSGGRGRLGRSWFSPPGENLYASFVLRPALDPKRIPLVTLGAGLAVVDAIAPRVAERRVGIKWPNDVFVDGRKVAGILAEGQGGDGAAAWIVVGIGINVRTRTFPAELASRATSLAIAGAISLDRGELLVDLAVALSRRLATLQEGKAPELIAALVARDELAGQTITIDGASATAVGIAEDGALVVRRADGREEKCVAGDVQLAAP